MRLCNQHDRFIMIFYPSTMLVFYTQDTIEYVRSMGVPYRDVERVVLEHWEHAKALDEVGLYEYAKNSSLSTDLLNLTQGVKS